MLILIPDNSGSLLLTLISCIIICFLALSLRVARVFSKGSNNAIDYLVLRALIGRFEGGISVKISAKRRTRRLSIATIAILISFSPNRSSKAIRGSCSCYIRKLTCFSNLSYSSSSGVGLRR